MFCVLTCSMFVNCVNYMHGKMYMEKKGTLGLENITLGVQKMNERDSLGC